MEKIADVFKQQLQHCEQQLEKYPRDELLTKALSHAKEALSKLPSIPSESPASRVASGLQQAVQSFTQSVLDSTYHEECALVECNFPPATAQQKIKALIGSLCVPVKLCGGHEMASSLLGVQIVECLHWRAGALMYMFCHTVLSDEERRKSLDRGQVLECCCVGVGHLQLMLTSRAPLSSDEATVTNDSSVPELLQKGVFSDVHMLGLMYAGELCYWSWEVAGEQTAMTRAAEAVDVRDKETARSKQGSKAEQCAQTEATATHDLAKSETTVTGSLERKGDEASGLVPSPEHHHEVSLYSLMERLQGPEFVQKWQCEFSAVQLGQDFLSKYIDVARGPLRAGGWKYDRAVQLLVKLKKTVS